MEVRVSRPIRRPAAEVFAFVADAANNPKWQKGMERAAWTSEPPHGVGSTYEQVARFLGREIRTSFVVTEHEAGRRVRIRSTASPFPIDVTRSVRDTAEGACEVSAVVRGEPGGFFRLSAPILRLMVHRSVRADYRRLARLLEGRGSALR